MSLVKAVVLAASREPAHLAAFGSGARELLPVANRPVLFHQLDALAAADVREVAIVSRADSGPAIPDAVGDGSAWGIAVTHVCHDGSSNVLAAPAVAEFVGGAAVLVHEGDVLLCEPFAGLHDDFAQRGLDALILRPGQAGRHGGPPPAGSSGCIVGPGLNPSLRREPLALDDALERLGAAGARVGVREVDACLPCRGGIDEVLESNRRLLDRLVPGTAAERVFDSRLQGAVHVHPSAEVRSSVIRGPVVVGPGARVTNSYVGPYTSIGAGAEVDCAELENSILLEGAQLRYIELRLDSSVLGPGARVMREFRVPRAVRLAVGAGAEVYLA